MKKLFLTLLCFALLLSACGPAIVPSGTDASTETGTAAVTGPGETTEALPPETTEPLPPETIEPLPPETTEALPTEPPVQFEGSATAGGIRVYTDPSAYRPYTAPEARYTRLRDGALPELIPSADYGTIYPYEAARLMESGGIGYSWETGGVYGFMDETGRILTDGIYTNIYNPSYYDEAAETTVTLPLWIGYIVKPVTVTDPEYSYTYLEGDYLYSVIAQDGSFVLPGPFQSVRGLKDRLACDTGSEIVIFDLKGNRLLSIDGESEYGTLYLWSIEFREGLYRVSYYDTTDDWREKYFFLNEQGEPVLGPYENACAFSEGLACVSEDGRNFGYIDRTGAWVIGPFDGGRSTSFENGIAIQQDGEQNILVDKDGNVLASVSEEGWFSVVPCGFEFYSYANYYSSKHIYYDTSGNQLLETWEDVSSLDETTFWNYDQQKLFRLSGEELAMGGSFSMQRFSAVVDGEAVSCYLGRDYERSIIALISQDFQTLRQIEYKQKDDEYYNYFFDANYFVADEITGEVWYFLWDGETWTAATESGKIAAFPSWAKYLTPRGGLFMTVTDDACCYLNAEGETVFRYPLNAED
jgi:hypothetical protein